MSEYQVKGCGARLRSPLRSQAALMRRSLLVGSLTVTSRSTHTHTPCVCCSACLAVRRLLVPLGLAGDGPAGTQQLAARLTVAVIIAARVQTRWFSPGALAAVFAAALAALGA